eukprot:317934-Alexandrium_andersonii.AAC.1
MTFTCIMIDAGAMARPRRDLITTTVVPLLDHESADDAAAVWSSGRTVPVLPDGFQTMVFQHGLGVAWGTESLFQAGSDQMVSFRGFPIAC